MRAWRAGKRSRDRQAELTDSLQRLREKRTEAARLRVVDEMAAAFGGRSGTIGTVFHELLNKAEKRGNLRQSISLLHDFVTIATATAKCSTNAIDTLNGTLRDIEHAAGDA